MTPTRRTTPEGYRRARALRQNTTEAEAKLWSRLRAHRLAGTDFRRQHASGPYIVDFCAPRAKLIIEMDGSGHLEQQEYDAERTHYLESKGYRVVRLFNQEVLKDIKTVTSRRPSIIPLEGLGASAGQVQFKSECDPG